MEYWSHHICVTFWYIFVPRLKVVLKSPFRNFSFQWGWGYSWTNPECSFHVSSSSLERNLKWSYRTHHKPASGTEDQVIITYLKQSCRLKWGRGTLWTSLWCTHGFRTINVGVISVILRQGWTPGGSHTNLMIQDGRTMEGKWATASLKISSAYSFQAASPFGRDRKGCWGLNVTILSQFSFWPSLWLWK